MRIIRNRHVSSARKCVFCFIPFRSMRRTGLAASAIERSIAAPTEAWPVRRVARQKNGWLGLAVLQQVSEMNRAKLLRLETEISHSRKSMQ